jgi:hypothetical protein
MRHLNHFENNLYQSGSEIFGADSEDIKECFDSFIDDFIIDVTFCKKLHRFNVVDTKVTNQDIKLGFIPYIQVRLRGRHGKITGYDLRTLMDDGFQSINGEIYKWSVLKTELMSRLSTYDLILKDVNIEVNSLIFLIYREDEKIYNKID